MCCRPAHLLAGLDTTSGQVELSENVDPPGQATADILQRTGLALDHGRVVFGFGGRARANRRPARQCRMLGLAIWRPVEVRLVNIGPDDGRADGRTVLPHELD